MMKVSPRTKLGLGAATVALGGGLALAAPASADQHGTNYCVSGVFAVHKSPDINSATVGDIHATEVWHHYDGVGNWSLGYVRGDSNNRAGYIPKGALTHDLGNGSTATVCPY